MHPSTKLLPTFTLASFFVLGCSFSEPNPEHCASNDGDAYCAGLHADGTRPYCEAGTKGCITPGYERFGCVAERPQDACYSPCGGSDTLAENGGCLAGSGTTEDAGPTSDMVTANPSSDDTAGPCIDARDCPDAAEPFCEPVTELCVACDGMADPDGACAELDPTAPLCVGGTCVQCTPENPLTCDEQLLACDGTTGSCVPCTEHSQCSSGACELANGMCFPGDFVVHVDEDGEAEYTSILDAVTDVPDDAHGVIIVHQIDDNSAYGPVIINDGQIIALLAMPGEAPKIQGSLTAAVRSTGMGTALYMDGLTLSGNDIGVGLRVDDEALAWVDRSHIAQNATGGIQADGSAHLVLRNSFVAGEPSSYVLSAQGATVDVLYSTLGAGTGLSMAIYCEASTVTVRNSVLVSADYCPEVFCPDIVVSHTALETDVYIERENGTDNVVLGSMELDDLNWFQNYTAGDFHLSELYPAAIGTAAAWVAGDPTIDIDGHNRSIDGDPDFAGADIPYTP